MRLLRVALRIGLAGLAFLAGCGWFDMPGARSMYGVYLPPWPHDPTVTLDSFSYTPASPAHVGDELVFRATLNKPANGVYLRAAIGQPERELCSMNDYGIPPDVTAGDGAYAGWVTWVAEAGTGEDLPVWVELEWDDGAPGQTLSGPPLTVLPEEEEQ